MLVHISGEDVHCKMRKTNSTTLPPYWGWVKEATYAGLKPFYEQMLQAWAYDEVCYLMCNQRCLSVAHCTGSWGLI